MTTRAELRDAINKWTYEAKRAESLNMHPNFAADYWDRVGAAKEKLAALDDGLKDLQQEKLKRELSSAAPGEPFVHNTPPEPEGPVLGVRGERLRAELEKRHRVTPPTIASGHQRPGCYRQFGGLRRI